MAGFVFQGGSQLTLDGKGRISVPARHREVLSAVAADQLTLCKHPNRCLLVFPRPAWEQFRDKLMGLAMNADGWRRVFLGSAVDVDIDSASRVLVPPELRSWAGLERDVMLLGMGQRFELWDKARLEAHEAEVMSAAMPEALQDMVL